LERGFPEKYARRGPDVITAEQLARVLAQFAEMIVERVPVDMYRKRILKGLESLIRGLGQNIKLETAEQPLADGGEGGDNGAV